MNRLFFIFIFILFQLMTVTSCSVISKKDSSKIKDQLSCPISITTSQKNLENSGYKIVSNQPNEIVTEYKLSEKERKTFILGSKSHDYFRRMKVNSTGTDSIAFSFDYKVIEYPHPSGNPDGEKTYYKEGDPLALSEEILKEIRKEVCKM
ncbi:MAG: hypothetical protein HQK49_21915 [Oligoflexia bacterium]|nr:hypothetical protein [Oligoflexia bacterium]